MIWYCVGTLATEKRGSIFRGAGVSAYFHLEQWNWQESRHRTNRTFQFLANISQKLTLSTLQRHIISRFVEITLGEPCGGRGDAAVTPLFVTSIGGSGSRNSFESMLDMTTDFPKIPAGWPQRTNLSITA